MIKELKENWKGIIVMIIGIVIAVYIGYIVIQEQVIAVRDYCQELVDNHTIMNMGDCNVTVQGLAEIRGINISVVD